MTSRCMQVHCFDKGLHSRESTWAVNEDCKCSCHRFTFFKVKLWLVEQVCALQWFQAAEEEIKTLIFEISHLLFDMKEQCLYADLWCCSLCCDCTYSTVMILKRLNHNPFLTAGTIGMICTRWRQMLFGTFLHKNNHTILSVWGCWYTNMIHSIEQ